LSAHLEGIGTMPAAKRLERKAASGRSRVVKSPQQIWQQILKKHGPG